MPRHTASALLVAALAAACTRDSTTVPETPPVSTTPTTPTVPETPAPPALSLSLNGTVPASETVSRVGVDFAVGVKGAVNWTAAVVVDSGTPAERRMALLDAPTGYASETVFGVAFAPGPGRHRFTVVVTDYAGHTASTSFERTFVFDELPYAVHALPALGSGADATAITEAGVVTGWVRAADGRRKPAIWEHGALRLVPAPDTIDVIAAGANAAGDVLLQYDSARTHARAARVRRADGTELLVGNSASCCANAVTLTESRLALGTTPTPYFDAYSSVLNVASDTRTDVSATGTLVLNDAGHRAGALVGGYMMAGRNLQTFGFVAPPVPTAYGVTICDRPRRFSRVIPLALDDAANLLTDYCGNLVIMQPPNSTQAGGSEFVDRRLGRAAAVRLSRKGGVLAALDSAGTLLTWRLGDERTARLLIGAGAWRVDRIAGVTGAGAIAAHGVDAAGREAALLLTPAASR